jgi:hypothetical protein
MNQPAQPRITEIPQKPWAKVQDQETLKLLMDNIHNLEYPLPGHGTQWLKIPYFQERLSGNPDGVREIKKRFCEAIVLLLEKNDRLKKRPGRPRKDDSE